MIILFFANYKKITKLPVNLIVNTEYRQRLSVVRMHTGPVKPEKLLKSQVFQLFP